MSADTVISVAPVAPPGPHRATVGELNALVARLFGEHRPSRAEIEEVARLAALSQHTVNSAHAAATAPVDEATRAEDLANCAGLYCYVLGYAAARRSR